MRGKVKGVGVEALEAVDERVVHGATREGVWSLESEVGEDRVVVVVVRGGLVRGLRA